MDRKDLWQEEVDLNSFDREKQRRAVMRLKIIGGERAIQLLISVLHNPHKDSVVRARAATMLGALKAEKAVVELVKALSIQPSSVSRCAAEALGKIGDNSAYVIQALSSLRKSPNSDLQKVAEETLAILVTTESPEVSLIHEPF